MPTQGLNLPAIYGAVDAIKGQQANNRLLDLQVQQAEQGLATQQKLNPLLAGLDLRGGFDANADTLQQITAADPGVGLQLQQQFIDLDAATREALDAEAQRLAGSFQFIQGLPEEQRPDVYQRLVSGIDPNVAASLGLGPEYDPAAVTAAIASNVTISEAMAIAEANEQQGMTTRYSEVNGTTVLETYDAGGNLVDSKTIGGGDTNITIDQSTERVNLASEEFAKDAGSAAAGRLDAAIQLGDTSSEAIFTLGRMSDILSNSEFETGPGSEAAIAVQSLADALGLSLEDLGTSPEQLGDAQEFRRLTRQLTLTLTGKLAGALSNKELDFLTQATVNLGSTTEANIKGLAALLAAQEFAADRSAQYSALPVGDMEAFQAKEGEINALGAETMKARAAEIEQQLLEKRNVTTTLENSSPDDVFNALKEVFNGG